MVCAFLLVRRMTLPMSWQYCNKIRLIQMIMKKCLKCGTMISDTANDYCEKCLEKNKLTTCEKTLDVLSDIILVVGIISSLIMLLTIITTLEGAIITIATIFSTILLWGLLSWAVQLSVNIRKIANSNK